MSTIRTTLLAAALLALPAPAGALEPPEPETKSGPRLEIEGADEPEPPPKKEPVIDEPPSGAFEDLATRVSRIVNRTTLGGYGEVEFHKEQDHDSFFWSHRYVVFLYSRISERISTATEIEFEHGGTPAKQDGVQGNGEVILEFSVIDFKIADWLVLRGGVLLVPFGMYNLRHDSPTWDLTERPKPLTTIVPTTWFEAGAGLLGTIELGGDVSLSYEVSFINGLDAKISDEFGMKGAVGSKAEDNNDDKAFVGRVALSPFLGMEIGVSGYTGEYDDVGHRVNMVGADLTLRLGRFELLAEYVRAFVDPGFVEGFDPGSPANTRTAVPEGMQGFYVQANVHFTIPGLWDLFPADMADATLTGIVRYEDADTNLDEVTQFDTQKLTFGLNFRPVEAYVIKTEVQLISKFDQHLFSGEWDPTWKSVTSMAFLF